MRYLPLNQQDRRAMCQAIGIDDVEELFKASVKESTVLALDLPNHQGELAVDRHITALLDQNRHASQGPFFLGAGCYYHHVPASVGAITSRSEYLTSYTPYQAEFSQGNLQVIYEFQTMIARLTGQEVANASMYDGATAAAEAMLMALRVSKKSKIFLQEEMHPEYQTVLHSYATSRDITFHYKQTLAEDVAAVIVQYPNFRGEIPDLNAIRAECDTYNSLMIVVVTEIVALGLLPPPTMADIVVGEAQSIGNGMNAGGPHLGFFACQKKYIRQMPGRLCGKTTDSESRESYVLTLNTREQHIRREKATSNICSNQGLNALAFTVHMALLGEVGFKSLALKNHHTACQFKQLLNQSDYFVVKNQYFFNEFVIKLPVDAAQLLSYLTTQDIIGGYVIGKQELLVATTEMTTQADMEAFIMHATTYVEKLLPQEVA